MTLEEKLKAAVRLPTVSYTDHDRIDLALHCRFLELLDELFPLARRALRREVLSPYAVLYTWEGSRPELPPALVLGHYDVVPAGDEAGWTRDPFGGEIAEGFVWGRGTLDDKASVIAALEAAEGLLAGGFKPERTLLFAFGGDEESSGREGAVKTARLLEDRGVLCACTLDEGAVVLENLFPGLAGPVALVGVAEKGFANVELRLKGPAGHAAMPPERTVAGRIARAAARIEDSPFPPRLIPAAKDFLKSLASAMKGPRRYLFAHPGMAAPLLLKAFLSRPATAALVRTSQAVTVLEGSRKENVLPDTARAVVNLRLLPGDDLKEALGRFGRIARDPEIEILLQPGNGDGEAVPEASRTSFGFASLRKAVAEVFPGAPVVPYLTTGCTDSRHYRTLAGDIYRFQPFRLAYADLDRIHGRDERISLDNLSAARAFYEAYLQAVSRRDFR